jgi:phosphate transport system permease protein
MKTNRRKVKDNITKSLVYALGSIGMIILSMIIIYVVSTGLNLVRWETIIGDSRTLSTDIYTDEAFGNYIPDKELSDEIYYSARWGIGIIDATNKAGYPIVEVAFIHPESPLSRALDRNNTNELGESNPVTINIGTALEKALFNNNTIFAISREGASGFISKFEQATSITSVSVQIVGGGIRGSIITTLWMIVITLSLAIPLGVSTAIYFTEIAQKSFFSKTIKQLVDMLTGVPSIIYGMLGAAVFVPLLNTTLGTQGGSVLSGALTLAVILLPTIIKSTEEALKVIPKELRDGSLALGANQTQTIYKVVLPNATPGILTGVLLGIGRIMGESAALIFAVGAAISDRIILTERASTLAVHIWVIMGGDAPNFELAAAISIIILSIVFVLNFTIKIISKQFQRNVNWS